MKKVNYIIRTIGIVSLSFSFLLIGCQDFLEENPLDRVGMNNYYTTEADAIAAVNSIYSWLGSYDLTYGPTTAGVYHSTFWEMQGLASDELYSDRPGFPQLDALEIFAHNSENSAVLEVWQMHYKVINVANIAIERIPNIDMEINLRDRLVNEAKFLRGLMYFNLVRMFGKVPLLLEENQPLQPEVTEVNDIYTQIIADLNDAEKLPISYPTGDGKGRATSGAAKALLAKVYLTQGAYQNAAEKALEVVNSGQYALFEDFADIWKYKNRNGKEIVFSVGFGDGGGKISFWEVAPFNVHLLPAELSSAIPEITNTQGWFYATENLYDNFDPSDTRRNITFMTEITKPDQSVIKLNKVYIKKYWDQEANPTTSPSSSDFPVIRYADILLTYAEAQSGLGNLSEANNYLSKVRERAGLPYVDIQNKADLQNAILEERRKEFVAEGHRWFDLVRMKKLEERVQQAKGIKPSPDYYLFPIPLRERDLNPNLPQNNGF